MSRIFCDHKDKTCDILHSSFFNGMSYKERQDFAFNKEELAKLSQRDKDLMRGYAQNIVEKQKAYKYKQSLKNAKSVKSKSK